MAKLQTYILFFWMFSSRFESILNHPGETADANNLQPKIITLSQNERETCSSEDQECNNNRPQDESLGEEKLVRLKGFQVGHIQEISLVGGQTHKLVTRSMRPLMFEIADFLSEDECDHIINLAKKEGLTESTTLDNEYDNDSSTNTTRTAEEVDEKQEQIKQCKEMITECDFDQSGMLSSEELASYLEKISPVFLKEEEVVIMLQELKFDENGDGQLSYEECLKVNISALEDYLDHLEASHPAHRSRISEQAWLPVDDNSDAVLLGLRNRVKRLTKLPYRIIEESEHLQVVRYSVSGHFHAHYDSTDKRNMTCCRSLGNSSVTTTCNLCRFMTILYYLNNVPRGGETAFPVADNTTFDEDEYEKKGLSNLSRRCYQSNIAIPPRKGTALLWYNHDINPDTGKMGPMDMFSLHGGCDVLEGVKWIANNWINDYM